MLIAAGLLLLALSPAMGADVKTLARGSNSGIVKAGQQVVRSEDELRKLWEAHTAKVTPRPPPPKVDFGKEMVLAVFLGQKSTGGYSAEILDCQVKGRELIVSWKKSEPGGGIVSQAFTQPYHMVAVGRSDLPVRFVEAK